MYRLSTARQKRNGSVRMWTGCGSSRSRSFKCGGRGRFNGATQNLGVQVLGRAEVKRLSNPSRCTATFNTSVPHTSSAYVTVTPHKYHPRLGSNGQTMNKLGSKMVNTLCTKLQMTFFGPSLQKKVSFIFAAIWVHATSGPSLVAVRGPCQQDPVLKRPSGVCASSSRASVLQGVPPRALRPGDCRPGEAAAAPVLLGRVVQAGTGQRGSVGEAEASLVAVLPCGAFGAPCSVPAAHLWCASGRSQPVDWICRACTLSWCRSLSFVETDGVNRSMCTPPSPSPPPWVPFRFSVGKHALVKGCGWARDTGT